MLPSYLSTSLTNKQINKQNKDAALVILKKMTLFKNCHPRGPIEISRGSDTHIHKKNKRKERKRERKGEGIGEGGRVSESSKLAEASSMSPSKIEPLWSEGRWL